MTPRSLAAALAGLAALAAPAAHAQFHSLSQDAPVAVPTPVRLAQGDAYAASPSRETALFGNPAHLPFIGGVRPRIQVALTAGVGGNAGEVYRFYDETLRPAFDEGIASIRESDPERVEAIYAQALRVGASQKTAQSAAEVSGTVSFAGVGVGVGVVATAVTRAQAFNGGAGIPYVDAYGQADLLVPVAVAARVLPGVSVGAQGTFVRRYVTAKAGPLDGFDPDAERAYVLRGEGVLADVGVYGRDLGLPGLDAGVAVHNVLDAALPLAYDRSFVVGGDDATPEDAAEIAALEARFGERPAARTLRAGVGYRVPLPPVPGVGAVRLMADYTSASTAEVDQSVPAGLRAGASASLLRVVEVRAGVSQGLPAAGASLRLPFLRLDYATYGVEDGALLGQRPRRVHLVQLRLGVL